jgi:predicted DNA-binding protein (UPF0251 family)
VAIRGPRKPPSNLVFKPGQTSQAELLEKALEAGRLWTRRLTERQIAERMGISRTTAHEYVQRAHAFYREQAAVTVAERIDHELRTLEETEREAWTAWERTIGKKRTTSVSTTTGGESPTQRAEQSEVDIYGDPQYLIAILTVSRQRAKLLGLNAPEKFEADLGSIFKRAIARAAELQKAKTLELPPARGG